MRSITLETKAIGEGYGHVTPEATQAMEIARGAGLLLDPTYTAKTFAAMLRDAPTRPGPLLFWQTLSSTDSHAPPRLGPPRAFLGTRARPPRVSHAACGFACARLRGRTCPSRCGARR